MTLFLFFVSMSGISNDTAREVAVSITLSPGPLDPCASQSKYGSNTVSVSTQFMKARTRCDRLRRWATTSDACQRFGHADRGDAASPRRSDAARARPPCGRVELASGQDRQSVGTERSAGVDDRARGCDEATSAVHARRRAMEPGAPKVLDDLAASEEAAAGRQFTDAAMTAPDASHPPPSERYSATAANACRRLASLNDSASRKYASCAASTSRKSVAPPL